MNVKISCPLDGEYPTPKVVYRADVSNDANSNKKIYLVLSETTFKERYRIHKREFRPEMFENSTKLPKYIWQLKRSNINFTIKYSIALKVHGNPSPIICKSCFTEKL